MLVSNLSKKLSYRQTSFVNIQRFILPIGQGGFPVQLEDSIATPGHGAPEPDLGGLLQLRVLVQVPPPQVDEQDE